MGTKVFVGVKVNRENVGVREGVRVGVNVLSGPMVLVGVLVGVQV